MNKARIRIAVLMFLPFALSSCVSTGPSRNVQPVPAGYLYEGDYINVRVPNSDGWHLLKSNPSGMEFARSGTEVGESFGAQVLMFSLANTHENKEFVALIKDGFEADTNSERFEVVESAFQYTDQRGYPCVSVVSIVKDKQAKTSPTQREELLLQSNSLYCRHPVRQETGFSIIYSHRGHSLYPNIDGEANEFISGVQVPGH
jgi:hypothetical protein